MLWPGAHAVGAVTTYFPSVPRHDTLPPDPYFSDNVILQLSPDLSTPVQSIVSAHSRSLAIGAPTFGVATFALVPACAGLQAVVSATQMPGFAIILYPTAQLVGLVTTYRPSALHVTIPCDVYCVLDDTTHSWPEIETPAQSTKEAHAMLSETGAPKFGAPTAAAGRRSCELHCTFGTHVPGATMSL